MGSPLIPEAVEVWLVEHDHGRVRSSSAVGGGCINNGMRLESGSGQTFFLKTNTSAPGDMFAREAEGLDALAVEGGPRVPTPYLYGETFLLLEDLAPAPRIPGYWAKFGSTLARLHDYTSRCFGFSHDNYIGSTPQPNPETEDGYKFFGEHRLLFQAQLAQRRGLLSPAEVGQVERLANRLPDLIPEQPASLIHGDLWSGNAITDNCGTPAIIDPAAHFGWAEAELAMTSLFGSFPNEFYQAYEGVRPLDPGYRARYPIYNLYHLLNHLNLFGRSYYGQIRSILREIMPG